MKNRIAVLVAFPVMLFAGAAFAQADPEAMMAELDADGNGSISAEEAAANEDLAAKFEELDADANGELSAEELAAMAAE